MSNIFDIRELSEAERQGVCAYAALQIAIEDKELLLDLSGRSETATCDCELEMVHCECQQADLAESVRRLVAPTAGVLWSEEAMLANHVEVVFELVTQGANERLAEVVEDRENWLAVLCGRIYEDYFDREAEFYSERGLCLLSFAVSDNLYELSSAYA